ncbi:MAG TPA: glycosyltransferase [Verrucomicrobiae bacterium]|jgi:GT2 family glycosyltransferase|nr:glycosyltransferase [Verrucomicrobiae bacterium]
MAVAGSPRPRVVVDGKFFRLGGKKFYVKGIAYGPLPPNAQGQPFASPEQTALDLDQIRELGANVLRVYHLPPRWFLDMADSRELKVLVDIPWNKHLSFDTAARRAEAREAVRNAVATCSRHPAVFAFSIANEIPPDIIRWTGAKAAANFIDELVFEARRVDPDCLCTYSNFPSTEFLRPRAVDFVTFNVYLHQELAFKNYLARLQMMADNKPLVLGEFGIDSLREGAARQSEMLSWQIEDSFRAGLAGTVVFTFTDEWFRDNRVVEDWKMGLVSNDRGPKESFSGVKRMFHAAPYFPLANYPKVSVVVASYNGARTLKQCLESLQRLNYPDYEIILVDDGSTDATQKIASEVERASPGATVPDESGRRARSGAPYPPFINIRHEKNFGLSIARNTGIAAATGEIVAFTDSDCRADEDWLYYLVGSLAGSEFVGVGGPNLLPPEDSRVAAAVMVSPGGPAHVMLTDREAEHIPGCNMAFYKRALEEIGGFDPIFMKAGDDVDVCWRLQQAGCKIGFSPSAFVWHYRRSTMGAYLKQQEGYGEAEALLVRKHPENFNSFGGGIWQGRIYASSKYGVELRAPVIYHGLFGSAGFQKIYAPEPSGTLMFCTTLEYHLFVTIPLWILTGIFHYLLPLAIAGLLIPAGVCALAGAQAELPASKIRWWSRPLVALLFFLQPIVRGVARYQGRLAQRPLELAAQESLDSVALFHGGKPLNEVQYWAGQRIDRLDFVAAIFRRLQERGWPNKSDVGWSDYDVEINGSRWSHLLLTTVVEDHPQGRRLVRCRLRAIWSFQAKVNFWALLGLEFLFIGLMGFERVWPWFVLLTLPVFGWFVQRQRRKVQSVVTVFLDQLAKELGLTKIHPDSDGH